MTARPDRFDGKAERRRAVLGGGALGIAALLGAGSLLVAMVLTRAQPARGAAPGVHFGVPVTLPLEGQGSGDPRLSGCLRVRRQPAAPAGTATRGRLVAWAEPSLCKPWPELLPPVRPRAVPLAAARGEAEGLYVAVRADRPLTLDSVAPGRVGAPGGTELAAAAIRVYRVGQVAIAAPSNAEGRAGAWPDPLIPTVDAYAGERRRALPHRLAPGRTVAFYVEVRVPHDQAPGTYRGQLQVQARAGGAGGSVHRLSVPFEVTVHPFALPATSSLPNTFGFNGRAALMGHHGGPAGGAQAERRGELLPLTWRYHLAALRHRISLHGGSGEPAPWRGAGRDLVVDFSPLDRELAPFLDGQVPGEAGARFTLVEARIPVKLTGEARASYVKQLVAHFARRGWLGRLFEYTWDEPKPEHLSRVRERARATRRASPLLSRLVTSVYRPELDGHVDIWTPVVNHLDDKPGNEPRPARELYARRRRAGKRERLFWYQSCMSHGCDPVHDRKGDRYFTGWPSYMIDAPALANRIFPWLAYRYGVDGELYFNTVEAYPKLDPWKSSYLFGGNGDGTLFYPGRPEVIGGRTQVPVESVRLKLIRDGLEDYEYLVLARKHGERALAERIARALVRRTHDWSHDPEQLLAARAALARAISRRLPGAGASAAR